MPVRRIARRLAFVAALALVFPWSEPHAALDLVVSKRVILGSVGGTVSNNRWSVTVQPGAYDGAGEVSVAARISVSSVCELEIKPASKNAFRVPTKLTYQLPVGSDLTGVDIQVYDPVARVWVDVPGCTQDPKTGRVTAPLWHFSTYRIGGRTGW